MGRGGGKVLNWLCWGNEGVGGSGNMCASCVLMYVCVRVKSAKRWGPSFGCGQDLC